MSVLIPAVIPVSAPGRAKGRLSGILSPDQRRELAHAALAVVASAAAGAGFEPVVVTADPAALPPGLPGRVLRERPGGDGLNAALEGAFADLGALDEALVLHADLPLATPAALVRLRAALPPGGRAVALVRSRDGGTNAMLLRPPGIFSLAYGPGSFARHAAAAAAAGFAVVAVEPPGLALDLDTPADVAAFLGERDAQGTAVWQLLVDWGVTDR